MFIFWKTFENTEFWIEHGWRVVQPAIDYWKSTATDAPSEYASGTWGPSASDIMMARDDRNWHNP